MPYTPVTPIVQELVEYFSQNPEFKYHFEQSFLTAREHDLQEWEDFNIHSVDDYLRYMDEYVHWVPSETVSGTNVYSHICLFYFVLGFSPVSGYQTEIKPTSHSPWTWLSEWLIQYAKEMGKWMDGPHSITPEAIETFVKSPKYRDTPETDFYDQYPLPPGGWKTFNEFFARRINPAFRPIAAPDDPTVIVSPADCSFDGKWPTDDAANIDIKGVPWSISQLLDDELAGTNYGPLFSGGVFTHSFLGPTDYHRQHAPVSGRVIEAKVIPGLCYLEVDFVEEYGAKPRLVMRRKMPHMAGDPTIVSPQTIEANGQPVATKEMRDLVAPNSPEYQFLQARGMILIESALGLVAVLPIGMAQVSSVALSVRPGDYVEKGQELSFFQFGGSDVVMVFQKDAQVQLDQDEGTHYNFGSKVGSGQRVSK